MTNLTYTTNKLIHSRRLLLLSAISCFVLFLFIWQGVESMFSEVADHKNTIVRLGLIAILISCCTFLVLYIYITNQIQKSRVAVAYAQNLHYTLESEISEKYKREYEGKLGEVAQMIETLEWERSKYTQKISSNQNISIPIDYSFNRNRIVFVEQKGNNKQTVYEYAYYEVKDAYLIVGKANFKRTISSVVDEKDSMGRFIGTKETCISQPIEVYIQVRLPIANIPEPYKSAIQLGALKTETVMSLAKSWGSDNTLSPAIEEPKTENKNDKDENSNVIELM